MGHRDQNYKVAMIEIQLNKGFKDFFLEGYGLFLHSHHSHIPNEFLLGRAIDYSVCEETKGEWKRAASVTLYFPYQGKVVAKFCAKYLHTQVLKNEASSAGDLGVSIQKSFFRMEEMMRGAERMEGVSCIGG
ncbi:uncharacterized protein A4U43_C06F19350 [Asparagus officinalis]|uniref:Uncharacterized protein n=1 Tax=Asparagus officinalis TaxID=4686 RepID=A0A5P1EMX8_ASPOF|nr:uncharacterized protein A4U43_C06F19350 [Asparagus officinalis]